MTPVESITAAEDANFDKRQMSTDRVLPFSTDIFDSVHYGSNAKQDATNTRKTNNEDDDHTKTAFYQAFKRLIICLQITGLFHIRPKEGVTVVQVYCWFGTIFTWSSVVVQLGCFRIITAVDINLISLLMVIILSLLCGTNVTAHLKNGHKPKNVRKFFLGFERLNRFGGAYTKPEHVRKIARIVSLTSIALVVCNICLVGYVVFETNLLDILFEGYGIARRAGVEIGLIVITSFLLAQWLMPNSVAISVSALLFLEYHAFYKAFKKKIDTTTGEFHGNLENDRQRYVAMARIVDAADKILALQYGATFGCGIANMCLILYLVVFYRSQSQVGVYVFWLFLVTADIAVKCTCGILVNHGARKFSERLHMISLDGVSKGSVTFTAFLSKASENIGYTVAHLFVLDPTVILSLVGLFVTYFLLILQYTSLSPGSPSPADNITTTAMPA